MDNNDVSNNGGQYRATSNLNTAIENPELNINNTMGVNIQDENQELNNNNLDSMENSSFDDNQLYQSNMVSNEDNNQLYQSNIVSNESNNGLDLNSNNSLENNGNKIYKSNILSDYVNDNNSNNYDVTSIENNRVLTGNDDVSLEKKNLDGNEGTNTFVPDTSSYVPNGEYAADNSNEKYEPVMENNKKAVKIAVPRDFKIILFIIFILVIFVLLMPYIYDFFRGLGLVITNNGK